MDRFGITVRGPFAPAGSARVTGVIAVTIDDWSFPEADWYDFVWVLLGWWLEALDDLAAHGAARLQFMDGPFEIRLMRQDRDVSFECVARSAHSEVVKYRGLVAYETLRDALVHACRVAAADLMSSGYEAEASELTSKLEVFLSRGGAE